MNDFTVKCDVDPIDDYQKARKDVIQAMNSFSKLNPQQQQKLFNELLQYATFKNAIESYNSGMI